MLGTHDMSAFELGVACEVFGTDRSDRGIPLWDFALCLPEPGPVRIRSGFTLDSPYGLDLLAATDLVIVPGGRPRTGTTRPSSGPSSRTWTWTGTRSTWPTGR